MDFDDALAAAVENKGPRCTLCRFIEAQPETQQAKINAALRSNMEQTRIARALGKMTGDPAWDSRHAMVRTHREKHL